MKHLKLFNKETDRTDEFKELCDVPNVSYAKDTSKILVLEKNLQWFELVYSSTDENVLNLPYELTEVIDMLDGKNGYLECSVFNGVKITSENWMDYIDSANYQITGITADVLFKFYIMEDIVLGFMQDIFGINTLRSISFSHFDLKNCVIDSTIGDNVKEIYFTKGNASNMAECILVFSENSSGTIYFNSEDWDIVKANVPSTWTTKIV